MPGAWMGQSPELGSVLVCSGCYDKIPQPGWLGSGRNFFLAFLEAGCLRADAGVAWFWRGPSCWLQTADFSLFLTWRTEGLASLTRALTPLTGLHPPDLGAPPPPEALPPNTITRWGGGCQHVNLQGDALGPEQALP